MADSPKLVEQFVDLAGMGRHTDEGWPNSAYSVSKAAMSALTRTLARDLAFRDIEVRRRC